ncbi:MAG TPA: pseudouridine synthase [Polyangiaceae bacterium]|nr:pseudouridine synthase [Polyangiaceae bacterium]
MATVRLQKVLARAGIASRRAAEELITGGHVRVDGRLVTELGTKVDPRAAKVEVDGERIVAESLVYVVLHKPRGVVSTMSDPEGRPSVKELLQQVPGRVYPIGRLDFATSGVLLATNDGDFAEALMHPRKAVPKSYIVKVQGLMKPEDLDRWRRGVDLEDGKTLPAKAKMVRYEGDKTWFELTITEGRNQQVRRMGIATDFRVMRLSRLSFAGVTGEGLRPGAWRYLTHDELTTLKKEHGVPKRVVSPPMQAPAVQRLRPVRPRAARKDERDVGAGDKHPRYGGGSPGRRDLGVREDWGGGVGRGSSGARETQASSRPPRRGNESSAQPPRGDVGGRGARTRTTGTGGGVGARDGEGSYRVRGRRG